MTKPQEQTSGYVVLLSSGLDSTYNLLKANESGEVKLALTFNYGQRAAEREIEYSAALCSKLNIPHKVVNLNFFGEFESSSLLNKSKDIPTGEQVKINDPATSGETAKSVWVPNRNGIFLNIGAGFAESLNAEFIVPGFNKEEAATFPDNSTDYMNRLTASFELSTANGVRVECFSDKKMKSEIVGEMLAMDFPMGMVWPCYFAGETICGTCESCQRFYNALRENGVSPDEV